MDLFTTDEPVQIDDFMTEPYEESFTVELLANRASVSIRTCEYGLVRIDRIAFEGPADDVYVVAHMGVERLFISQSHPLHPNPATHRRMLELWNRQAFDGLTVKETEDAIAAKPFISPIGLPLILQLRWAPKEECQGQRAIRVTVHGVAPAADKD